MTKKEMQIKIDDLKHNYNAINEMHNNSVAYASKIQDELNDLKRDVARYFELVDKDEVWTIEDIKEFSKLKEKLKKVGKEE